MNNKLFLANYIKFLEIANKQFGNIILLDHNFNIIFLSQNALTCFKDKTEQELLGINFIWDLPRPAEIIAKKHTIFTNITTTKKPTSYIAITSNDLYHYRKMLICATPIINPKTNNLVAIELSGNISNQKWLLSEKERSLHNKNNQYEFLSNYELEIIFFKTYKKTDSEIALILSSYYQEEITPKMINNKLSRSIYYKLGVNSLKALREKAHAMGIDNIKIDDILPKDDIMALNF